ncbi:MKRN2 opposite strand protein isoform X2 [Betta splendens]|uniref:MKRN2 opposite strand protein isoform X2 n=1 Tax=Betta splendens TaxID=158456 RepID=A0A9W2XSP7_BETSP|nr:MKRN2 opposite strand protein isoform X2 [Betta splendens]
MNRRGGAEQRTTREDECPSCAEELRGSRLQEAPVSLPSPLTNAHKTSCCLVVAPAYNNQDTDFDGTSDLHTGISSTKGVVFNYTRGGVRKDHTGWERCVSVPLVRPDMFPLLAQWDQYLERFAEGPMWDPAWHRFDQDHHNCFSFCLCFINGVLAVEGRSPLTRETFTQTFILPKMRRVSKYTTLYQNIQKHQYYMVNRQDGSQEDTMGQPEAF